MPCHSPNTPGQIHVHISTLEWADVGGSVTPCSTPKQSRDKGEGDEGHKLPRGGVVRDCEEPHPFKKETNASWSVPQKNAHIPSWQECGAQARKWQNK